MTFSELMIYIQLTLKSLFVDSGFMKNSIDSYLKCIKVSNMDENLNFHSQPLRLLKGLCEYFTI